MGDDTHQFSVDQFVGLSDCLIAVGQYTPQCLIVYFGTIMRIMQQFTDSSLAETRAYMQQQYQVTCGILDLCWVILVEIEPL